MNAFRKVVSVVGAMSGKKRRTPLDYVRLTNPQLAVANDGAPIVLWRDGNQLGKSWLIAWTIVQVARGTHPFVRYRRPPVEIMVISISKDQMVALHQKIWDLLPKEEIDERCSFDPGRGITGKPPRIVFTSGPGKDSVIHLATYKQGATRIAGGTYVLVVLDEPPPQSMYGEVVPRLMRMNGRMLIGMTPTPDMPNVLWLREKVESGEISEHNFGVSEENLWVKGSPTPFKTQDELDAYERSLLRNQREMRMRGAWEPLVEGNWLDNFERERHVREFDLADVVAAADGRPVFVMVGYDHGTAPNKEAISLSFATGDVVDRHDKKVLAKPMLWAADEDLIDGHATPELVVEHTVRMLKRNGLDVSNVDVWVGDRSAQSKLRPKRMANRMIMYAWAEHLGVALEDLPFRIETAYKPAGSVAEGLTMLNALLARTWGGQPALTVHPRCAQFIDACATHKGATNDPLKDVLDAFRYPAMRVIRAGEWMTSPIEVIAA